MPEKKVRLKSNFLLKSDTFYQTLSTIHKKLYMHEANVILIALANGCLH